MSLSGAANFADILEMFENRGAQAVIRGLERTGVVYYNREDDLLVFREMRMTPEFLRYMINHELQRKP